MGAAAFALACMLGRRFVRRMLAAESLRCVDQWVARYGAGALLFSRFVPAIAFNLLNYAAGLTRMSWWTFKWMTGLGIVPVTMLMVVMGDQIETILWQAWLLLPGSGLVLWWLMQRLLQRSGRTKDRKFDLPET
jgi:uncharacterized membrane protein YdjX (TVP38/TMEM64 family)